MIDPYRGRMATRYDTLWRTFTERMHAPVIAAIRPLLHPGVRVLDIGCGTGALLAVLHTIEPALQLFGVDGSAAMLAQARQRLDGHANLQVRDLNRTPLDWPIESGSFDIITCTNIVHYLVDPLAVFEMLRDSVKPQGLVLIVDFARHGWWWPLAEILIRASDRSHRSTLSADHLIDLVAQSGMQIVAQRAIAVDHFWQGVLVIATRQGQTASPRSLAG
jgi:Methylase involved in ubiquinone/menaquinone biosynthesis